ncbi:MAG: hypothetical protein NUV51_09530 [Sulfuricaulis sp.]|nr:hypothetical protein [Sulfuricaulis sp.]
MSDWEYMIRAYLPANKGGCLLIETVHRGEHSRDMEISIFKERMKRGEVGHIEVVDMVRFKMETLYA